MEDKKRELEEAKSTVDEEIRELSESTPEDTDTQSKLIDVKQQSKLIEEELRRIISEIQTVTSSDIQGEVAEFEADKEFKGY